MSLSEQIQRVDGSQNDIIKALAQSYGISTDGLKIDQVASAVKSSQKFKQDGLFSAATAALFGLTTDAVPDDALKLLSRFHSGLGNEYMWGVSKVAEKEIPFGSSGRIYLCSTQQSVKNDVQYAENISVNDKGEVSLENPTSISLSNVVSTPSVLSGKYFLNPSPQSGGDWITGNSIVKISDGATVSVLGGVTLYVGTGNGKVSYVELGDTLKYVNSPSVDDYPPSVPDGYVYTPLGQLGNKVRIETGSYVGTGTYGADNPNTLTFGFEPKFVVVVETGVQTIYGKNGFIWLYNSSGAFSFTTSNPSYGCTTSLTSNIFYWYGSNANNQLNVSDTTYNYVALG